MDEKILKTLRLQAWERAKGELNAVLATYWDQDSKFPGMEAAVTEFIAMVDDKGYAE